MRLAIILPSRNEANLARMVEATDRLFPEAQIIASNERDGLGKGYNVRMALQEVDFEADFVAIIDGDMDIHPRMLYRLLPFICDYDIVVGRKQVRGTLQRRLLTRLSRLFIWAVFGLNLDTQTGIKLYRRPYLMDWRTDNYAYDIEVLAKARDAGARIIEVPVETDIKRNMKFKSIIGCLIESIKIRISLWAR